MKVEYCLLEKMGFCIVCRFDIGQTYQHELTSMIIFQIAFAIGVAFLILRRPYLGLVLTAASLPVADVLPKIAFASSVVPLIGAITLFGFLLKRIKEHKDRVFSFINVHVIAILFISWMFISNPQASWFGPDRNWIFTFFQLWVLIWLAGELLDAPEKHHVFMWMFSIVTVVSALIAIQQGSLGEEINQALRSSGLAQGANTAARYFVIATVFLIYLRIVSHNRLMRLLATSGAIITFIGVFFTVSRSGMLLLFVALGLLVLLQPHVKYRFQLVVVFVVALIVLWSLSENIFDILKSIAPTIAQRTDTVGLRYTLWKGGWRMWLDHPIQGVGIGMYPRLVRNYGPDLMALYYWKGAATHNMFIQVLAETGFIGFGLFTLLLGKSLQNILRAGKIENPNIVSLRNVWLIVFLIMLLGGITKSDQADKMIWMAMGVSVYFYNQVELRTPKTLWTKWQEVIDPI